MTKKEIAGYTLYDGDGSVNGIELGDHYAKIFEVFPEATAKVFENVLQDFIDEDPSDEAGYYVYYYNGEIYTTEEYYELKSNISIDTDYNENIRDLHKKTCVLCIIVKKEYIISISFGDYYAVKEGR